MEGFFLGTGLTGSVRNFREEVWNSNFEKTIHLNFKRVSINLNCIQNNSNDPTQSFTPYQNHPSFIKIHEENTYTLHQPNGIRPNISANLIPRYRKIRNIYTSNHANISCDHCPFRVSLHRRHGQRERERERKKNKRGFTQHFICYSTSTIRRIVIRHPSIFSWSRVGDRSGVDRGGLQRRERNAQGCARLKLRGQVEAKKRWSKRGENREGFTCADSIIKIGRRVPIIVSSPLCAPPLVPHVCVAARVSRNLTRKLFKLHSRVSHPRLPPSSSLLLLVTSLSHFLPSRVVLYFFPYSCISFVPSPSLTGTEIYHEGGRNAYDESRLFSLEERGV